MQVKLERINLKSGESIEVVDGITVIVGPNNAGKSLVLREIVQYLQTPYHITALGQRAINTLDVHVNQTVDELLVELKGRHKYFPPGVGQALGSNEPLFHFRNNIKIHESVVRANWDAAPRLGELHSLYVLHFAAENRTGLVGPPQVYDTLNEEPANPIQRLYLDKELEEKISSIFERSFGQPLTLNRFAGISLPLHVGRPKSEPKDIPPAQDYRDDLAQLPFLHEQGDGMRSFAGIVLNIMAGEHRLLLIDEPEAFLHPPQARLLGRVLAELQQEGVQAIIATHSIDIVQGLTSASARAPLSINRLTRRGNDNHVASVPAAAVTALYTDPLLRHSSILNGLFYHGVIMCESEGDCTYYSVVDSEVRGTGRPILDLHFSHCNGKDRIPQAVQALSGAKVPVASVLDVDLLQSKTTFDDLVTAHGGAPASFATWLNEITAAVNVKTKPVKRSDARSKIDAVLGASSQTHLDTAEVKAVREAVKSETGWQQFKVGGRTALPPQALRAFDAMDMALRAIGIFLVPVGELERFHPTVDAPQKARWLQEVLEQELFKGDGLHVNFVIAVREYIASRQ